MTDNEKEKIPVELKDLPPIIKFDLDTELEYKFRILIGIGIIVTVASSGIVLSAWKGALPPLGYLMPIAFGFLLLSIGIIGYNSTDNYYILKTRMKAFYYHFQTFGQVRETPVLVDQQVFAVGVTGKKRSHAHTDSKGRVTGFSTHFEYTLCVIDQAGKILILSDPENGERVWLNKRAGMIAQVFGCKLAECPVESSMNVEKTDSGIKISFDKIDK